MLALPAVACCLFVMSVQVPGKSRMLLLLAACVLSASALPHRIVVEVPKPEPSLPPPPPPTLVLPTVRTAEIDSQTEASAGAEDTPCGPVISVGSGVGLGIKEDGVVRRVDAKTGARGGCGPLFATVESGTTTKVGDKDPLSANSVTTLTGVEGIVVGISQSSTGGLVQSGQKGAPAKAIASVSQASGIASKDQKTTHAGSGTVTSDGVNVTNTAGDSIKAQVQDIIKKNKCQKAGKRCYLHPPVSTIKPTLPAVPEPTLKHFKKHALPKLLP